MKTDNCSMASNPIPELTAKIRHFYDLHYLLQNNDCKIYLQSSVFKEDLLSLFIHDQQIFDKPAGWQNKSYLDSPLISDFHTVWLALQDVYLRDLPDLAYKEIASTQEIEYSVSKILKIVH